MVSRSLALALLAFSFTASAQQGAAGRWNASVDSEFGPFAFVFEFLVDAAGKLTGSLQSEFFSAPIKDAVLDGNKLSFKLTIDGGPNGPMNISYTGVVKGNELELTSKFEGAPPGGGPAEMTLTATRAQ
jgi:hypothetical protein